MNAVDNCDDNVVLNSLDLSQGICFYDYSSTGFRFDWKDFGHAGSSGNVFSGSQLGLSVSSMGVVPTTSRNDSPFLSSMGVAPSSSFSSSRALIRTNSISSQTIDKIPRLDDSNLCSVDSDSDTSSIISYCSSRGVGRPKNFVLRVTRIVLLVYLFVVLAGKAVLKNKLEEVEEDLKR
uniref:Uncharacterized protein n=1 Tax=Meloidogyne enterolobii TaxID=390850 RepID=A0A6V7W413_MELEN|nr:unnamed protein product [Meloidogyne enterolobii]